MYIGIPKTIYFPFGMTGKLMVFDVPILKYFKVHRLFNLDIFFLFVAFCCCCLSDLVTTEGTSLGSIVLLFYVHGKHLRSCRDGQLT